MTVAELIEVLKQHDPKARVLLTDDIWSEIADVEEVVVQSFNGAELGPAELTDDMQRAGLNDGDVHDERVVVLW